MVCSLEEKVLHLEQENKQLNARQSTEEDADSEVETKSVDDQTQPDDTENVLFERSHDDILDQYKNTIENLKKKYEETLVILEFVTEKCKERGNIIKELVRENSGLMHMLEGAEEHLYQEPNQDISPPPAIPPPAPLPTTPCGLVAGRKRKREDDDGDED